MILALHADRAAKLLDELIKKGSHDIRDELDAFARAEGIEI
jgi:hypothetical protein